MERYGILNRLAARVLGVVVAISGQVLASAPCVAPEYRTARNYVRGQSDVSPYISIRLEDFAPARLICLAGALREAYPGRNVNAAIFSSHKAALDYGPGDLELRPEELDAQFRLHGMYVYDKGKHEEYVMIEPDGTHTYDPALITRIDLPVLGTPTCKVGINDRCLLEFEHIYYPSLEHRSWARGQVTLAGSIQPDGTVAGVSVLSAQVDPIDQWAHIVKFAAKNLRTWRFEPAERKNAVRVTYRFEGGHLPLVGNGTGVQFRLPDEVIVQAAP